MEFASAARGLVPHLGRCCGAANVKTELEALTQKVNAILAQK